MKTLLILHQSSTPTLHRIIQAISSISSEIECLIIGSSLNSLPEELSKTAPLKKIHAWEGPNCEHPSAIGLAQGLKEWVVDYDAIVMPTNTLSKAALPALAALMDCSPITDVIGIVDSKTFIRPIYAGNAHETICFSGSKLFLTIQPTAFVPQPKDQPPCPIEYISATLEDSQHRFVSLEEHGGDRPDLTTASMVVSGGRGLGSKEGFKSIFALADHYRAAVGASRAAVDLGYAANDMQVGQTGKIIAPDVYIALGISGAIQHLAGMKDSQIIIAVNSDPDAPIFQIATIGLVADAHDIIERWLTIKQCSESS